jgi:hypothetical protein
MHASTLSETRQYIERFIEFAIENIHTEEQLANFLDAVERKIDETTGPLQGYLLEIEERVLTSVTIEERSALKADSSGW